MGLLVDVIHGIQKNTILSTSIEKDVVNGQVLVHIRAMVLVDMPPLLVVLICCGSNVAFECEIP